MWLLSFLIRSVGVISQHLWHWKEGQIFDAWWCLNMSAHESLQHNVSNNRNHKKAVLLLNVLCYLATTDKGSDISLKRVQSVLFHFIIIVGIRSGDGGCALLHYLNITVKNEKIWKRALGDTFYLIALSFPVLCFLPIHMTRSDKIWSVYMHRRGGTMWFIVFSIFIRFLCSWW